MKRTKIILFILLFPTIIFAQNENEISKPVNKIVNKIAKEDILMGSAVYYSGMKPEQYTNFEKLKEEATRNELVQLTNNENGVVRCYSFWALAYIDNSDTIINILKEHLNDTTIVETQFGCIGSATRVGDFFLNIMTPQYVDLNVRKLSETERKEIDNLLLYTKNSLNSKSKLLTNIEPSEENYNRIRQIAITENNPTAILALSKYQKQQDIYLIKELLANEENEYWGVRCIINFPDSTFKNDLERIQQREIIKSGGYDYPLYRVLYKAIVQYKDEWSLNVIQATLSNSHKNALGYHKKYIWLAIKKFPNPIYDEIFKSIELKDFELMMIDRELEID